MFDLMFAYFRNPVFVFSICFLGLNVSLIGIIIGIMMIIEKRKETKEQD